MPEYLIDADGPAELIEQPAPPQQFFEDEPGAAEMLCPALQGPPGAPGGALVLATAGAALSGHMAVAYGAAGLLEYASADNPAHALALLGVTTGAASAGAPAAVQRLSVMEHLGWTWTPGAPVYLGLAGALVQTPAPGSVFLKPIGLALTAQRLMLAIQPAVVLAL